MALQYGAIRMEGEHIMAEPPPEPAGGSARRLLRAARVGTLASASDGQPFASLVTPAPAPDGAVLLLLSELAEHTRHLRREPRCALLLTGVPEGPNPQTAPRVTVTGLAEQVADAALQARWLAVHPYAALYAGFADFHLWRIAPAAALFVGGFARATRLRQAELAPDPEAAAAILAAEPDIIGHCNTDHPDAMAAIGTNAAGAAGDWRMVAADVDGCDLALADRSVRVAWAAPVSAPAQVRAELIRLAQAVRASAG
jgi:putative heme iron utilization protein